MSYSACAVPGAVSGCFHGFRVYATLREQDGRSQTVCGGARRVQHVYTSDAARVEVRVLNSQTPHTTPVYFLLKAQGTVSLSAF